MIDRMNEQTALDAANAGAQQQFLAGMAAAQETMNHANDESNQNGLHWRGVWDSLASTLVALRWSLALPVLAPATLAALPSTRAIPNRDVFYVADAIRSIETRSLPTFGIRSRIVSVNEFAPFGVWCFACLAPHSYPRGCSVHPTLPRVVLNGSSVSVFRLMLNV